MALAYLVWFIMTSPEICYSNTTSHNEHLRKYISTATISSLILTYDLSLCFVFFKYSYADNSTKFDMTGGKYQLRCVQSGTSRDKPESYAGQGLAFHPRLDGSWTASVNESI